MPGSERLSFYRHHQRQRERAAPSERKLEQTARGGPTRSVGLLDYAKLNSRTVLRTPMALRLSDLRRSASSKWRWPIGGLPVGIDLHVVAADGLASASLYLCARLFYAARRQDPKNTGSPPFRGKTGFRAGFVVRCLASKHMRKGPHRTGDRGPGPGGRRPSRLRFEDRHVLPVTAVSGTLTSAGRGVCISRPTDVSRVWIQLSY